MAVGKSRELRMIVYLLVFLHSGTWLLRQNKTLTSSLLPPDTTTDMHASFTITSRSASISHATASVPPPPFLTFDILSIGSKTRLDYLEGQRDTFGSHVSVRHFFGVTEDVDDDVTCSTHLTTNETVKVAKFCAKKYWNRRTQMEMKFMRNHYASIKFLLSKENPSGWLCAQTRPIVALSKVVLKQYRTGEIETLPDYLIIVDDDTHLNVPMIQEYFQSDPAYFSGGAARTIAGCLVRKPIFQLHFTMNIGGQGLFLSQATIQKMIRPIHCETAKRSTVESPVVLSKNGKLVPDVNAFHEPWLCDRIQKDFIGEAALFKEGMSVSDLMYAYATDQPFTRVDQWTRGYCMHSDWMWGFFTNFYNLSDHDEHPYFQDIPQARMVGYNQSEIYDGRNHAEHIDRRRVCDLYGVHRCFAHSSPICHYMPPASMRNLTNDIRRVYPEQFRT